MFSAKPVGPVASVRKYDLLSSLMAYALASDKASQRRIMRFMSLLTTRYNWRRNELIMGQEEISRLWQVDVRTVKREIAQLKAIQWVEIKRQGSRGHVNTYGINIDRIFADTQSSWPNIGPDFIERMKPSFIPNTEEKQVIQYPVRLTGAVSTNIWSIAQKRLHDEDQACYAAWFDALSEMSIDNDCLVLSAPTKFHANYVTVQFSDQILRAVNNNNPEINKLRVQVKHYM